MANIKEVTIKIKTQFTISLWQAIKLRLAGKGVSIIAEWILEDIKNRVQKDNIQ